MTFLFMRADTRHVCGSVQGPRGMPAQFMSGMGGITAPRKIIPDGNQSGGDLLAHAFAVSHIVTTDICARVCV